MKCNKLLTPYNFTNANNTKRIKYIVIHYVGALGGAKANCEYYASQYVGASAHYYVGFDGEIWQSVEDGDIAWHCGAYTYIHPECRNSNSIGIELCVRKKSSASMNATDTDWYFEDATVKSAIELTKYLMKKYGVKEDCVIRHYDVTGKICPNPYVYNNTKHTWSEFKALLKETKAEGEDIVDTYYRVRTDWNDSGSQIFAGTLEGAKQACIPGYSVFDPDGKIVYSVQVDTSKGFQAASLNGLSEPEKIKKIAPLYQECMEKTGMLASVGIAQFCLESGYGTTDLAQYANNMHGMKKNLSGNNWVGSAWDGVSVYGKYSPEVLNGVTTMQYSEFRKYACVEDSIADRAAYFKGAMNGTAKRYPNIEKITDPIEQIKMIKSGGYATDPNYVEKLSNLINRFNLTQYDIEKEQTLQEKIVSKAKYFQTLFEEAKKEKNYWYYANSGYENTYEEAVLKPNLKTNCVILVNWIYKSLGLWKKGLINHRYDGTSGYKLTTDEVKNAVQKNFKIISVNKKLSKLIKLGKVNPGDMIIFKDHVQLIIDNKQAFDGGRNNCNGLKFRKWIGPNNYLNATPSYIIRPKGIVHSLNGTCTITSVSYIVQAGAYDSEKNAKTRVDELSKAGFSSFVFKENNLFKVQCGSYYDKKNAENQVEALKKAGFEAIVKTK